MHCLQKEDGTMLDNQTEIRHFCEKFYTQLLNGQTNDTFVRESAIEDMLQTVDACIEQADARRLELPFEIYEIRYALSKLGNEKTHGHCGISKEFVVAFWDELKDIIMCLINSS
ncbi:hypothetical protein GOP47_0024059 [Adiantum capillus-veneris]|uniref:Uncharacterized protein n=1 Tax=Adiantum capillus-veneris TaxID=13818 RepID=A0A9D4Z517_ADICA|nr:hypothetical protein GOP47_0024059 [Adiantum capillus-veneris]